MRKILWAALAVLLALALALTAYCALVPGARDTLRAAILPLQPPAAAPAAPPAPAAPIRTETPAPGPAAEEAASGELLRVHMLDVGQGSCVLVTGPGGKSLLLDAGESGQAPAVRSYLRKQGIGALDMALITHMDSDHVGAFPILLHTYPPRALFMPKGAVFAESALEETLRALGLTPQYAHAGMLLPWEEDVELRVLSPLEDVEYPDENEGSLVLRLSYGSVSVLFTGDAGAFAEEEMLSAAGKGALRADLLMVGHHGSANSTMPRFLRAVAPRYAFISCGRNNSYGHPHQMVLNLLENHGVSVYRSDLQGACVLETDGKNIWVWSGK